MKDSDSWMQIIGIVADARDDGLRNPIKPAIYVPYPVSMGMFTQILVRTRFAPLATDGPFDLTCPVSHQAYIYDPAGLSIPAHVPGIPDEVLDPRQSWADKAAYDRMAAQLVERFEANFAGFEAGVGDDVKAVAIRKAA